MKTIDQKIINEIQRYKNINKYLNEQDDLFPVPANNQPTTPPSTPGSLPGDVAAPAGDTGIPSADPIESSQVIDVAQDPDIEKIGNDGQSAETTDSEISTDENGDSVLDISDLVNTQKDMSQKQEEYFNNLFSQLSNMEVRLGEMDALLSKVNQLEIKFDKYRPKTPQEKLELRSLDSGPYNQKLTDFFDDKEHDMEQSGKHEYVLTTDDVENYSNGEIKKSFSPPQEEDIIRF